MLQEGLFIGTAVTQASLIDYLLEASSAAHREDRHESNGDNGHERAAQGGMPGVYTALAHHLQRIAGNPVSTVVHPVVTTAAVLPPLQHMLKWQNPGRTLAEPCQAAMNLLYGLEACSQQMEYACVSLFTVFYV